MGDSPYTPEELKALGEGPEEPPAGEGEGDQPKEEGTGEPEKPEGDAGKTPEGAAKAEDADDGQAVKPVPVDRFNKVYGKMKTFEEKLELLRNNPEEYRKRYPEEFQKAETRETPKHIPLSEAAKLRVVGGPYAGRTLAEVLEADVVAGLDMYDAFKQNQAAEQTKRQSAIEQSQRELADFEVSLSKEMFGKANDKLTGEERAQVKGIVGQVLDWMTETGRGGGRVEDAYFLMNKDNLISKARGAAARRVVEDIAKGGVSQLSTGTDDRGGKTGFSALEGMTEDQIMRRLEKMPDAEYRQFLKEASPSFRKRFPDLPYAT